jgi:acyl-CoA thioester hydrolase
MNRPTPGLRKDFPVFQPISTRWADNDVYGHVNNVVYYEWFDTAVNAYLISQGALNIGHGSVIGLVVQTHCDYFSPISFPQQVFAGIRVANKGTSSVRYEIALFADSEDQASAQGHFVHVYVDRQSRRPCALPPELNRALEQLSTSGD